MPSRTWGHPGSVDHIMMELSLRRSADSSGNAAKQRVRPSIHVSNGHPTVDGSSGPLPSIGRESPLLMVHRSPYFMRVATTLQNSSNYQRKFGNGNGTGEGAVPDAGEQRVAGARTAGYQARAGGARWIWLLSFCSARMGWKGR